MPRKRHRSIARLTIRLAIALLLVSALYGVSAVIGSGVAANRAWHQADAGTAIWVADNGIHTDLVLPAIDFRDLIDARVLGDARYAGQPHLAIGWGDRDFYLNTPSWWEMNPVRLVRALVGGGPTVLHVAHAGVPREGPKVRRLVLRPDEYRALVAFVRGSFAGGQAVRGYGAADAFYPARGGYNAVNTCNAWTGRALRSAGVKMGVWTPLPFGVMQWL